MLPVIIDTPNPPTDTQLNSNHPLTNLPMRPLLLHLFASIIVLTLAGCSTAPQLPQIPQAAPQPTAAPDAVPPPQPPLTSRLSQLYEAGDYSSLLAESEQQIDVPSTNDQALIGLLQLSATLQINGITAEQLIPYLEINRDLLAPRWMMQHQMDLARILFTLDPYQALIQLMEPAAGVDNPLVPPPIYAIYYAQLGETLLQMGQHLEAARASVRANGYLNPPSLQHQQTIWRALSQISPFELTSLSNEETELEGWIELLQLHRDLARHPDRYEEQLLTWRARFPTHPITSEFLEQMRERNHTLMQFPQHVAVLLPSSGKLSNAANAIRDGLLSAWYTDPNRSKVELRFYDTAADPDQIEAILQQTQLDGADFILGPLDKSVVNRLMKLDLSSYPTILTLNRSDTTTQPRVYHFALSPEDEAVGAATRAWYDGYGRVSMLLPNGNLGIRIAEAFRARWEELGGTIASEAYYDRNKSDFSGPIQSMLELDLSNARHKKLQKVLGVETEFTPRRRQDIDLIFISAQPRQARLIKPQLRFYHASELPVFATSHLYTGSVDPNNDRDMDGIIFGDLPWKLRPIAPTDPTHGIQNKYSGQLQGLAAMGLDAYALLPLLPLLEAYPYEIYQGETGQLTLNRQRNIERTLMWARFSDGVPHLFKEQNDEGQGPSHHRATP